MFEEYQVVLVHSCPEEGSENMRFNVNVASPPWPALKDITSRSFVSMYRSLFMPFPLLCVVHLPVFLSFSVSLLVPCALSGVAKRARCYFFSVFVLHKILNFI